MVTRGAPRRSARRAPRRSASRSPAASSSVSVRSGDRNATLKASERLPSADLVAAVLVEDARRRAAARARPPRESPPRAPPRARPRRRRTPDPAAPPGYALTSSYATALGRRRDERIEIELERAPGALEQRGMELADPALARARRPCRDGGTAPRRARTSARCLQRRVELLDRPLRARRSRRRRSRRRATRSSGSSPPAAGRRARSRRARPRALPTSTLCARGLDQARQERRAQHGELRRERLRQATLGVASSATKLRRVRLREAAARRARPRRAGAAAASASAGRTSRRRAGSVNGISSSWKRATSSTRSISRVTSRARQVGTRTAAVRRARSRAARGSSCCSSAGTSSPITRVRALGPEADDRPLRQLAVHVGVARPARARELDDQLASRAPPPARRGTGRRPSPSGSSPRCAARAARSVRRIPTGSKFAASSRTSSSSPTPRSPRRP